MKKIFLSSLMAAAAAIPALAGVNNLNYQAVIKDGANVVADKEITLKFELVGADDKAVFTEEQTVTTNAAGYVACQIGKEGDLTELNWGDLKLRVSIDNEVYSVEEVSSVPTAIYALKSADSDMIIEAVEGIQTDVEMNKTTLLGVNAELVKLNGFVDEVEDFNNRLSETIEPMIGLNYAELEDFNDRITKEVIALQELAEEIPGLVEDNAATKEQLMNLTADVAQIEGLAARIEELNTNTEAFAEMNETRLDKMQKQMDEADKLAEENYDDLKGSIERQEQQLSALQGKQNADIEGLTEQVDAFADMVEARFDKVQGQIDLVTPEVEDLVKDNEETKQQLVSFGAELARIDGIAEELETFKSEYQEDFQRMADVSAEMSNAINEFKAEYQEDFQRMADVSAEMSNAINEFKSQYAEDWQNLVKFQDEISTDFNEFKNEFGETFQGLSEFQQGVTVTIEELKAEIAALKAEIATLKGE